MQNPTANALVPEGPNASRFNTFHGPWWYQKSGITLFWLHAQQCRWGGTSNSQIENLLLIESKQPSCPWRFQRINQRVEAFWAAVEAWSWWPNDIVSIHCANKLVTIWHGKHLLPDSCQTVSIPFLTSILPRYDICRPSVYLESDWLRTLCSSEIRIVIIHSLTIANVGGLAVSLRFQVRVKF